MEVNRMSSSYADGLDIRVISLYRAGHIRGGLVYQVFECGAADIASDWFAEFAGDGPWFITTPGYMPASLPTSVWGE